MNSEHVHIPNISSLRSHIGRKWGSVHTKYTSIQPMDSLQIYTIYIPKRPSSASLPDVTLTWGKGRPSR